MVPINGRELDYVMAEKIDVCSIRERRNRPVHTHTHTQNPFLWRSLWSANRNEIQLLQCSACDSNTQLSIPNYIPKLSYSWMFQHHFHLLTRFSSDKPQQILLSHTVCSLPRPKNIHAHRMDTQLAVLFFSSVRRVHLNIIIVWQICRVPWPHCQVLPGGMRECWKYQM